MNIDTKALETIINSKIRQTGGMTLSIEWITEDKQFLVDIFSPSTGYQVGKRELTPPVPYRHVEYEELLSLMKSVPYQPNKPYYIGLWLNDGILHIDESLHIIWMEAAIQRAKSSGQKAIWSWKEEKEIFLSDRNQHVTQKEPSYED